MNKIEHFAFITTHMLETYKRKNADYGDSFGESVQELGIVAAITRISDKCNRLKSLINNPAKVADESMRDTLLDLANYAVMTLIELDNQEVNTFKEKVKKEINIDRFIEMAKKVDVNDFNVVKELNKAVQEFWYRSRARHLDEDINKLNDFLVGCVIVMETATMTDDEMLKFMIYMTEKQSELASMILMNELSID